MGGPLEGVRVLDMTSIVLGPLAAATLASMGAEVVKIEAPEGDNVRQAGVARHDGMGHVYLHGNGGKRSIVLDLKREDAKQVLLDLVRSADVLLSNVRPAAMRRLGLDAATLATVNPRLVFVTACGYAAGGPYADRPAYDDLIQAATGIPALMQQHLGGEPAYVPLSLADRVTGLHAVYAVTAALFARERTGQGQQVEVPMFESVAHFVLSDHLAGRSFVPPEGPAGYDRLLSTNRRPYATLDGHLAVLVYNDRQWRSFVAAIGQPQRMADPRFATQRQRSLHIHFVYGWVAGVMRERRTAEWIELLTAADIPHQVPRTLDELIDDPQLRASGLVASQDHPTEGPLTVLGAPVRWSAATAAAPAPGLGQHTRAVLAGLGYDEARLEALSASGAIG